MAVRAAPCDVRTSARCTTARAATLTRMVMANSTTPEADEAPSGRRPTTRRTGWRSPPAWRRPESNRLATICGDAPMTSADGDRSRPSPGPDPSITAPTMPPKLWGSTAPRIISQRVAPRARARLPSHRAGTVAITSRLTRGDDRRDHDRQDDPGGDEAAPGCRPGRRTGRRGSGSGSVQVGDRS